MRTAIICEYNPLHNGHLYQLQWAKKYGDVICIMSGSFVQRGEPAIFDKWTRAQWALKAGADLVLELPVFASLQSAQGFARGAIRSLAACGMIDAVCFGCETANLPALEAIAQVQLEQPLQYRRILQDQLQKGVSYATSLQVATQATLENIPRSCFTPNAILGIEYLKALKERSINILPLVVHRDRSAPTASFCRERLLQGADAPVPDFVQQECAQMPKVTLNLLEKVILYNIRRMPEDALRALPDLSEGLEDRLKKAAQKFGSLEEVISQVSTKRYTKARIRRLLCAAALGLQQDAVQAAIDAPPYLRVLGIKKERQDLLSLLASSAAIPVFIRGTEAKNNAAFSMETAASDLYSLAIGQPIGQDFSRRFITV